MPGGLITIAEGRRRVLAALPARPAPQDVPVDDACGRVLARDVTQAGDVPPFASSAMDGFAAAPGPAGRTLRVAGESRAGRPAERPPGAGEAVRISTGAVLPSGELGVIPVEQVTERDGVVETARAIAPGQHVRGAGEDVEAGVTVLGAGTVLGPVELGVAVGAGRATLPCAPRPRVAVLATGDELVGPGAELGPGQIHNTNEPTLAALAAEQGAEVVLRRAVPDDPAATRTALGESLDGADLVLISGGVSVGPHDHVKPALDALGVQERFWRVALQPGKPTWFGTRGPVLVLGLPGNPVSSVVCFHLFARTALRALQGAAPLPAREPARLDSPVARSPAREQAVRVAVTATAGGLVARSTGAQGSHRLTSLLEADALAFVPAGEGDAVAVELERR